MKFITLDRLIEILQDYQENFGGNIPILLSDKDSPNPLTNLVGAYIIDIMDPETDESQDVILLCNMTEDELLNDEGFEFSEEEGEEGEEHEDS